MKTKKLIGKLMLFLLSFTFISCKTYKNSEVNSIGIIGSADGPTAIYIKASFYCRFCDFCVKKYRLFCSLFA